jgi:copper transport protein
LSSLFRRSVVLCAAAGAVILGLLLAAPQASAHAVVVGSDPADGSRSAKAPTSVTVRFDEPVGLSLGYLRVVDTAGRRVDVGSASHPAGAGSAITVALKANLGDGSYLASFRVVSADSHPIAGSIRFVVGNGPLGISSGPNGAASVDRGVASFLAVSHWASFAGVALVGGSWLIFSLWPSGQRRGSVRRAIWAGWSMAVIGAVGEFLLQGPYAAGSSLSTIDRAGLLDATLHVNSGQLLSLRLVLLGVLGAVLTALFDADERRRPSWGPEAAAIVGVGIVVTFAASGHSQTVNPRWFGVLVDALHLTAMIVWLGGLAMLVIAALDRNHTADDPNADDSEPDGIPDDIAVTEPNPASDEAIELAAGLPIFSRVALASVVTLAVTGTIQAWREVGTVDAITTTWYGRLVVVKVILFVGVVALGYLARRIVQRRDWTSGRGPLQRLRRTLFTEVSVGVTVLAVTGVLIAQPPGAVALAAERSKPKATTVAVTSTARARVEVTPGAHGPVEVEIVLSGTITATKVSATATLPAKSLGPIALELQSSGPRTYLASGVLLPSAGDWKITLTVQTSEFDATTAVAVLKLS